MKTAILLKEWRHQMTKQNLAVVDAAPKPALVTGNTLKALIPQSVEEAWRMAEMIYRSGIAPRDMNAPEKIVTSIFYGMEVGLPPMQAVQSIAVVNGRPTIWGDAALGLVQGSGKMAGFKEWIEGEGESMTAFCTCHRVGYQEPIEYSFTVADAKTAGLWGKTGPWKQYPKRMLALRARAFALRNGFADVLKGLGVREEVADYITPNAEHAATQQTPQSIEQQLLQQSEVSSPLSSQAEDDGSQFGFAGDHAQEGRDMGGPVVSPPAPSSKTPLDVASDIATMGMEALERHWKAAPKHVRDELEPHKDELKAVAAKADAQAPVSDPETGELL
jgi:hypothetical protein